MHAFIFIDKQVNELNFIQMNESRSYQLFVEYLFYLHGTYFNFQQVTIDLGSIKNKKKLCMQQKLFLVKE